MAELISIREAAEQVNLSYPQIANLARNGKIKGRKSGHIWLIDLESLKEYMKEMAELGEKKHGVRGKK